MKKIIFSVIQEVTEKINRPMDGNGRNIFQEDGILLYDLYKIVEAEIRDDLAALGLREFSYEDFIKYLRMNGKGY